MALAVVERNALLEEVWDLQAVRDYAAIVELIGGLPLEDHLTEPELGLVLSLGWYQLGEHKKPLSLLVDLKDVCERRGNTRLARRRRNNEALMRLALGELDSAESLLHDSIVQAEYAQDTFIIAAVHNNLGLLYSYRGMTEFSLSHLRRSIAAGQRLGDARHLALCHLNMGDTCTDAGLFEAADQHLALAAELSRSVGSESEVAHIEYSQAALQEAQGDTKLAAEMLDRAFHRFTKLENRKGEAIVFHLRGRIALREDRLGEARQHLEHALTLLMTINFREGLGTTLADLAELENREANYAASGSYLKRAIELFKRVGHMPRVMQLQSRLEATNARTGKTG